MNVLYRIGMVLLLGVCMTHAAQEDGRVPEMLNNMRQIVDNQGQVIGGPEWRDAYNETFAELTNDAAQVLEIGTPEGNQAFKAQFQDFFDQSAQDFARLSHFYRTHSQGDALEQQYKDVSLIIGRTARFLMLDTNDILTIVGPSYIAKYQDMLRRNAVTTGRSAISNSDQVPDIGGGLSDSD